MERNHKRKNPNRSYQDQNYGRSYGGKPGKKMTEKDNYSLQAQLIQDMMNPQPQKTFNRNEYRGKQHDSHDSKVVDLTNEEDVLDVGSQYFKEDFLFYPWRK
jgi:hypothetical protein